MLLRLHYTLTDNGFWDRKLRLAILTLASFAALC